MTDDLLKQELIAMGQDLRQYPSVAASVMATINLPDSQAGGVESLSPTCDSTGKQTSLKTGRPFMRRQSQWARGLWAFAITTATVSVIVVVISGVMNPRSVAFAQIKERLASIRTASLKIEQSIVVSDEKGATDTEKFERKLFIRSDGRVRMELPDGHVSITSEPDFRMLEIDRARKAARLTYLYALDQKRDVITTLRSLHQNQVAHVAEAITLNGKSCPGFRIEEQHATLTVWVDPTTRLPVHAQRLFRVLNEAPPTTAGTARRGKTQITETYSDMKFDQPLADKLFDVAPPVGYALTTVGTPPADRPKLLAQPLVLTPKKGVGPLQFGMSKAEVDQLLGKPDKSEIHRPMVPITDSTTDVDDLPRPPGGQLAVLTELQILEYKALGLKLITELKDGLTGITCFGQEVAGPSVQNFACSTDKGIRVRSSEADVRKTYGEPDQHASSDILAYEDLGLQFQLAEDRTVRLIMANDGIEHRLRIEWRVPAELARVEQPLGQIIAVDTDSNVVTINLGSADRLARRTTFSVYTKAHRGVARGAEDIKGAIEVIQIMGTHLAQARITQEMIASDRIAPGDPIYTPAWSPGRVEKFAMVGKFDFDGDGKHDEQQLIELIETNGARIGAAVDQKGVRNTGKIDHDTKFLVVGEIPDSTEISDPEERRAVEKVKKHHEVMQKEAMEQGVAVVTKNDFLSWMGYRPQHKLYRVGDPRPNNLPGSRTNRGQSSRDKAPASTEPRNQK